MGNCITRCCGKDKREEEEATDSFTPEIGTTNSSQHRKYLRTRYSVDRDFSIEFENLMDDTVILIFIIIGVSANLSSGLLQEVVQDEMNKGQLELQPGPFTVSSYVRWLAKQEEELRMEEEAYYEARREAARIARIHRVAKEQASKTFSKIGAVGRSWLGENESEWDVAGGEDDFEMFLASVKARSLSARTQLRQASADGQSTSSSTTHTRDRSHTEASSLDLEWDHEAGIVPQKAPRSATEENLVALAAQEMLQVSPVNSNDLEWDNDYVSADVLEREQLLTERKSGKAT